MMFSIVIVITFIIIPARPFREDCDAMDQS